jgi:hypothetical protein
MANPRSVFSQLLQWIPKHESEKGVDRYQGDRRIRKLSCRSQFVGLLFGQLTGHKYVFLTNRFDLAAKTVCDLLKRGGRWNFFSRR